MQLILVRHSKTLQDKTKSNLLWQLSPEGIQLAELLAKDSLIQKVGCFYTSDQTKAIQTTLLLAKDNYIPIRVFPELTEATSITNGYFDDYEHRVSLWHQDPEDRINNGETSKEALARFNKIINSIITNAQNSSENIGIVSHANVLSLFTAQFENRNSAEIHKQIRMPDTAILDWESRRLIKRFGDD
jgi:broad specificity phosphatase PhoE